MSVRLSLVRQGFWAQMSQEQRAAFIAKREAAVLASRYERGKKGQTRGKKPKTEGAAHAR